MTIVDVYTYFGKWPFWPVRVTAQEDFIGILDKHRIEKALVASTKAVFYNQKEGNREISELVQKDPKRLAGYAVVNPRSTDEALAELRMCIKEHKMRGLMLFPAYHDYHFDEASDWRLLLEEAAKQELPVAVPLRIAMNWSLTVLPIREVASLAKVFPKTKIILCGVNYSELRDALTLMKKNENVFIETSCLQGLGSIEYLVNEIGARRILLGTGLILQYPACGLAKIVHAQISEEKKDLIMGENASNLFSLEPRSSPRDR